MLAQRDAEEKGWGINKKQTNKRRTTEFRNCSKKQSYRTTSKITLKLQNPYNGIKQKQQEETK